MFIDEKKTEMLNNFSTIENIDTSDISSILDLAFVSGKFNYTPYEFYNRIFEITIYLHSIFGSRATRHHQYRCNTK